MRLEKCWFCSSNIYPGHGIAFARNDGQVFRFCRSKCHKNFKMKRNPRKVKWTKAYRKLAGKELAEDTTFEMERRRNRPEKYNRTLVAKSLNAIKTIDKIRNRRQERFYEERMRQAKKTDKKIARQELEKQIHLVRAPESLLKKEAQKSQILVPAQAQRQMEDNADLEMSE